MDDYYSFVVDGFGNLCSNGLEQIWLCSPTAETSDLKSLQYRFESDHSYQPQNQMKLLNQRCNHTHIGTQWERKISHWEVSVIERTDFSEELRNRFGIVTIEQSEIPNNKKDPVQVLFKGTRTNWFDADTKDKQKKFIIAEAIKFIQDNTNPMIAKWVG